VGVSLDTGAAIHHTHIPPAPPPPPAVFTISHTPGHSFDPSQCVTFVGDFGCDAFLDCSSISSDAHLLLHDVDPYLAHAAVRHAATVPTSDSVLVSMPVALRKNKAFTPWLCQGLTLQNAMQTPAISARMCLMVFIASTMHVRSLEPSRHSASFDFRVGGSIRRARTDSGSTCSCMAVMFAVELDLKLTSAPSEQIAGIGGTTDIVGTVTTSVMVGESYHTQTFFVLSAPIGGYDGLLGDDYSRAVGGSDRFSHNTCCLEIGHDPTALLARIARNLTSSSPVQYHAAAVTFAASPDPSDYGSDEITSHIEFRRTRRQIREQIAYVINVVSHPDCAEKDPDIPSVVQDVIEKHSGETGTLRGDIRFGAHAQGFEM
jgi:hypothetical protein